MNLDPQHDDHTLLARIDERTRHMAESLVNLKDEFELYVTKVEFQPVKMLVFGFAGLLLSAVLAAIIALVFGRAP